MEEQKFVQAVLVTSPGWPPCLYMVKALNNLLLLNSKADNLKTWYAALGAQVYQVCSYHDPGMTLSYFTARSKLVPYSFVWEKGKTVDFSETIVVYDVKVGRCSSLNEYMNLY